MRNRSSLAVLILSLLLAVTGCATGSGGNVTGGSASGVVQRTGTMSATEGIATTGGRVSSVEATLAATPDAAWPALMEVYRELGLEPTVIDERTRTLGVRRFRVRPRLAGARPSAFLDCGQTASGTIADVYTVELDAVTTLRPRPAGGSTVQTSVGARAVNPTGSSTPVGCGSSGSLEGRIAQLLRQKTGEAQP